MSFFEPFASLLLATGNRGKYNEFMELLPRSFMHKLIFAPDAASLLKDGLPQVEENASTYAMNALTKAMVCSEASGLPSLADDSGLEVAALGWLPGVRSARVMEEGRLLASDAERNRWLLSQMEGRSDRHAAFVAAVALSVPGKWALVCEGVCEGRLAESETGEHGFGYDPLFIPEGYDMSFGGLPFSVKNRISHRAKAVKKLIDVLTNFNQSTFKQLTFNQLSKTQS